MKAQRPPTDSDRLFAVYQLVVLACLGVALLPVLFVSSKFPYVVIWTGTLLLFLVISRIAKATAHGDISRRASRSLAPLVALLIFAAMVSVLLLKR